MAHQRFPTSAQSIARTSIEVLVALGLLLFSLETFAHRTFSPEPRYRAVVLGFALLAASLGLLPLLMHCFPRAGGVGVLLWLLALIVLLLVGFITKPRGVRSTYSLSPDNSLQRATGGTLVSS